MCAAPFMGPLAEKFSRKYVIIAGALIWGGATPVSYTHLDVYKRQEYSMPQQLAGPVVSQFANQGYRETSTYPDRPGASARLWTLRKLMRQTSRRTV